MANIKEFLCQCWEMPLTNEKRKWMKHMPKIQAQVWTSGLKNNSSDSLKTDLPFALLFVEVTFQKLIWTYPVLLPKWAWFHLLACSPNTATSTIQ